MKRLRHLLNARLLQSFDQDREPLVQRHPGLEQMSQLFGENQELAVRNLQALTCRLRRHRLARAIFAFAAERLNSDRDTVLLFDLADGDRAIRTIQHTFDETTLRIARAIGKLWHLW